MSSSFINFKDINKSFYKKDLEIKVLEDINLSVTRGEFICVLGPSGCGKSTLFNILAGFIQPTKGDIYVDKQKVISTGVDRAVVFQTPQLYTWLNVEENIAFPLKETKVPKKDINARVEKILKQMGLIKFRTHKVWEISGGMKQRVAIARAWITNPKILLMDEPFGALDVYTREVMQQHLINLRDQMNTTIFFITHDIDEAIFLADKIILMSNSHPSYIANTYNLKDIVIPRSERYLNPKLILMKRNIIEKIYMKNNYLNLIN